MTRQLIFILLTALLASSCATICKIPARQIVVDGHEVEFGESKMPCKKVSDFNIASEQAIKAIFSDEFEIQLENWIKDSVGVGEHTKAWEGLNAHDVVTKMRSQIRGTYADTYGGIKGLWLYIFYHNLAKEGPRSGPILLNRIPLKKRTSASISNTIAHEVSHRIGLTHPHSNIRGKFKVAEKEPPYVVGDIVQGIIEKMNPTNP